MKRAAVFGWILSIFVSASFAQNTATSDPLECAKAHPAAEAAAISRSNGAVKRNGCVLTIGLHQLTDNLTEGGEYIRYDYDSAVPGTDFHLVSVRFYESSVFELVSFQSRRRIVGRPVLSPDRRRVLAASYDLIAAYNPNTVQILNIEKRSIAVLEISLTSELWGPSEARWVDSETVEFTETYLDSNNNEAGRKGARLRHSPSGWLFQPSQSNR